MVEIMALNSNRVLLLGFFFLFLRPSKRGNLRLGARLGRGPQAQGHVLSTVLVLRNSNPCVAGATGLQRRAVHRDLEAGPEN